VSGTPPLPSIATDKPDYAPGETVTLSGANWGAGESVHVVVNDDGGQTWRYENDVTAAADGSFSVQFNLPDWFVATYTAAASGSSGTATTTFTDANVQVTSPSPARFPSTGQESILAGQSQNFAATVNRSGASADPNPIITGVATQPGSPDCPGTSVQTFPASWVTVVGQPITVSGSTPVTLGVTVPSGQAAGDYQGRFRFTVPNGNATTNLDFCVKVVTDATAPVTTATPDPEANAAGWNKTDVSVSLSATDNAGGSGVKEITYSASGAQAIASTTVTGSSVSGISITAEGTTTLSFFAKDNAGNTESTKTLVVKIDKTAPTISDLGPTSSPNAAGWYNHDVVNRFKASDGVSGLNAACESAFPDPVADGRTQDKTTSGEGAAVKVSSSSCTDVAGNTAAAIDSAAFKIDKTAPTVTINVARDPDHNGWYNHPVGYRPVGSDTTSGIESCQPGALYSGPDSGSASVSRTCTDNAGNEGTGSRSFMFDATAPEVTVNLARDPDRMGWYNHGVGYHAVGSDVTSGLVDCDPAAVYGGPDDENASASLSCRDNAGNEGTGSRSFMFDATAPTIVASLNPPANGNGWNNTDVTVSFTCDDNLSGIDPSYGCPAAQVLTSEGLHTLHVATSDVAGNVVTPSFDVRIDKTDPTISGSASPAPNVHGWNNTNVVVSFTCFDGLSGIDFCEPDHTLSSNGAGQSASGDARDKAGNEASATVSGINIDKVPPSVEVTGVTNGATYTLGSVPTPGCSTSDALSGVQTAAALSLSGGPVGSITATCGGAEDKAGNTNSAAVTYTVIYDWNGFFQPIDNNPDQSGNVAFATVWNSAKAGQAIPVKFSLSGNQGLSIFATGYPKSVKVACPSALPVVDAIETYASSTSGLHYDAVADQYVYVWKTATSLAGTCQRLEVKLVDGTSHYAFFRLVK
jgi:hypothetical protein